MSECGTGEVVRTHESPEELSEAAAAIVVKALVDAHDAGRVPALVLAGGSTPGRLYRLLASDPWRSRIERLEVYLFWGDERVVPLSDPASNFRMVKESLLDAVSEAPWRVHRIEGELTAGLAAERYEREIESVLGRDPEFDLVLLGVGEDGHTASLFPATGVPDERLVIATRSPRPPFDRVSLTYRAIAGARQILFLVSGRSKAAVVAQILGGGHERRNFPAGRVRLRKGTVIWALDRAAAAGLSPPQAPG